MATLKAQFTAYTSSRSALTANGTHPNEYTCAAPKEIPFGTKIKISGTGTAYDGRTYTVTDRGGAIKINSEGRYIFDLWMESESQCIKFGRRNGLVITNTGNTSSSTSKVSGTDTSLDIVDIAIKQIGANEADGSHMKFINWYGGFGRGTPWCAIFVSWCANQAGVLNSIIPKFASCASGRAWFESKGLFKYKGSYIPKRGDIIFFLSNGASHTGVVEKSSGGKVYTIEGNTSDRVARRNYDLSNARITGYGTPKYDSGTISSSTNSSSSSSSSHSSEEQKKEKAKQELKYLKAVLARKQDPIKSIDGEIIKSSKTLDVNLDIVINNGKNEFKIPVLDGAELTLERIGTPGKLTFKTVPSKKYPISEGNGVLLIVNKKKIFYGFVFTREKDSSGMMSVTVYDQIRYLKNQDTLVYVKKTATQVIEMIAKSYQLQIGSLDNTNYAVSRTEEDQTLLDMIQNALDETILMTGKTYVFFDKVGKLTLKEVGKLMVDCVVTENTAQDYKYQSTIDSDVYNRIKLTYKNDETNVSQDFYEYDQNNINKWGVLQYTDSVDSIELGKLKAKALLSFYNKPKKSISFTGVLGDTSVIAGSLIPVILNLGDKKISNYMLVEKVIHKFANAEHRMDLTLSGGDFSG